MPLDPMKAAIRIHPIFVREGWTWHNGTPSVFEIAETIQYLMELTESHGACETGRIRVEFEEDLGLRVLLLVEDEFDGA